MSAFSSKGVGKTNDIVKQIHQRKTSIKDGRTDGPLVRNRLELGHDDNLSRPKRKLDKIDLEFLGKKGNQVFKERRKKN